MIRTYTILTILILSGFLFFVNETPAQVIINPVGSPQYQNNTEYFWNVTLGNSSLQTYMVKLKIQVTDNSDRIVIDESSSTFTLKPGTMFVNSAVTGKVDVTEGDSRYKSVAKNGILPSGIYKVKYTVQSSDTILANTSIMHEVINLTNIQLIYPGDNEKISEELSGKIINFNWLPSGTPDNNKVVRYNIVIVEMYGRQSKIDAIQNNPALIKVENLIMPFYLQTPDKREFVPGRNYAWQIYEMIDTVVLARSEVYEFAYQSNNSGNVGIDSSGKKETGYNSTEGNSFNVVNKKRSASIMFNRIKPFEFSLTSKIYGENSNRIGTNSNIPQRYASWELTPLISIYGIPFTASIFLSSLNSVSVGGINSFSFDLDFPTLKDKITQMASEEATIPGYMKFLGYFNKLNLGTSYPDYTPFTINGVPLKGMDFEFNPGKFFLASSLFSNLKAENNVQFRRNIYTGRIGYGRKETSHLFLTALYGSDNENSITINPPNQLLTPKENFITGLEGKLLLIKEKLELNAEITSSTYTRNKTDALTSSNTPPFFAKVFMDQRISTASVIAYSFRSKFTNDKSNTVLESGIKMIGTGYSSLGVPYISNDKLEIDGKVNQKLLDNRMTLSASAKWNRDNLDNTLFATTNTTILNLTMNYSPRNLPYFVVVFAPYFQKNDAANPSFILDNKFYLMTFVSGYTKMFKSGTALTSTLSYVLNKMDTYLNSFNFTNHNVTLSEALNFRIPLILSGSFSGYFGYSGLYTRILSCDLNATYTSFEIWTNTIGANYSFEHNNNRKIGLYIMTGISAGDYLRFDLSAEQNFYNDWLNNMNDYKEFILRGTVTTTF